MIGRIVILLSLFSIVHLEGLNAQVWCPPGATWYYRDSSTTGSTPGFLRLQYTSDVMLDGQLAQYISVTITEFYNDSAHIYPGFDFHTYQDGPIVYCKTEVGFPWDTLYHFGAVPGDHWDAPHFSWSNECLRITVTDTGTTFINGFALRYMDYTRDSLGYAVHRRITERLGDSEFYFLMEMCTGPFQMIRGLRCYSDDAFGSYDTGISPSCDFLTTINDQPGNRRVMLHPNPGCTHFTLDLPPGPHTITLFDATGRLVLQQRTTDARPVIGTEALPAGLFRIAVCDEQGAVMGATWVKE